MKVGLIAVGGSSGVAPVDVLRCEFLAAAVRMSRAKPRCACVNDPVDPDSFQSLLGELRPHILFFYMSPETAELAPTLTEIAYRDNAARPQFIIGPWPTLSPEMAIKSGPINGLLRGECDVTLGRLLSALSNREQLKRVPGLWLRRPGAAAHESPLGAPVEMDRLPVPGFEGFDWPRITAHLQGTAPIEASRGCNHPSLFNFSSDLRRHYAEPRKYRRLRPVEDAIRDIQTLRSRIDPLRLEFVDEIFPHELEWLREFASSYPREVGLPFTARLASALHSPTTIDLLAQAGLIRVKLGLESGDARLRSKFSDLNPDNEQLRDFAKTIEESGAALELEVLLGLPGERTEHMAETVKLLESLPFERVTPRACPMVYGTDLYRECEEKGLVRRADKIASRDTMIRNGRTLLEIGHYTDLIHRMNLERQARQCQSERGYYSFIDHTARANHRVRDLGGIGVTRRNGEPAFTMAVPAESSFHCFVQADTDFLGRVELLRHAGKWETNRQVQVDVTFTSEGGDALPIFSKRLKSGTKDSECEIRVALPITATSKGVMTFSARDAGGGDGMTVAWIDPVLDHPKARGRSEPRLPRHDTAPPTPKPVPEYDPNRLDLEGFELPSSGEFPRAEPRQKPSLQLEDEWGGSDSSFAEEPAPRRKKRPGADLDEKLAKLTSELEQKDQEIRELRREVRDLKRRLNQQGGEEDQPRRRRPRTADTNF